MVLSLPLKLQQYPGGLQPTPVATTTLEICLSTAKPGSRQGNPCCSQPILVVSIAIAGGPQQTSVVPSHHYGGPQLTHAQHPCRHYNNMMVLCLTNHSTQEVLSQPLYPSQHSVGLQPTTVTITANLLVLAYTCRHHSILVVLRLSLYISRPHRWSSDSFDSHHNHLMVFRLPL